MKKRFSAPPIPQEHGAWAMLYAPILVPLIAVPPSDLLPGLLLIVAATAGFCLQNVVTLLLRGRGRHGYLLWLGLYLSILVATSLPLLVLYHLSDLVPIALLAVTLFAVQGVLTLAVPRQRLERSFWGQAAGAAVLTLTGPAAWVVARGELESIAWQVWMFFALFFVSGVLLVNMLLAAARAKQAIDTQARWRVGRGHLFYHLTLFVLVVWLALNMEGYTSLSFLSAYAPLLGRAFIGWARLSHRLPRLKQVGRAELFYALWFTFCLVAWLRAVTPGP